MSSGTILGSPLSSLRRAQWSYRRRCTPSSTCSTTTGYTPSPDRLREPHQFDPLKLFDFALRAAMLTDLDLSGHLENKDGKAWPTTAAQPADPVLRAALAGTTGREWAQLISYRSRHARQVVRDQLETTGWLHRQQRRMLGIIPTVRLRLYDKDMLSGLADRVIEALHNAIDDRPADPRPLAVGLLACQARCLW